MDFAKDMDANHLVKQRDSLGLIKQVRTRLNLRNHKSSLMVEIGSGTGKTTSEMGKMFATTKVVGIESERSLHDYARTHYDHQANLAFACASVAHPQFWTQLASQVPNLKKQSVDIVISTHCLRLEDPDMETILANIDGFLVATMSVWSELFEIEKQLALRRFPHVLTQNQHAGQLATTPEPNRLKERELLKRLLQKTLFGDTPEVMVIHTHLKIKAIKKLQNIIKWLCPIGQCLSSSDRSNFYREFFDAIHEQYFESRGSLHSFGYEYLAVCCCKTGKA